MTKHIAFFGGPGTGKSTTSSGLFHKMKTDGYKVEYATEVAKDLVYSKRYFELSDQLMILARSHHQWFKLENQVDYAIHDGPFLLGPAYINKEDKHLPVETYTKLVYDLYNSYDTLNIFLQRDISEHPYQEYGRNQSLQEAMEIDEIVLNILKESGVDYHIVKVGPDAVDVIYSMIK